MGLGFRDIDSGFLGFTCMGTKFMASMDSSETIYNPFPPFPPTLAMMFVLITLHSAVR